jgi:hypothetical protein
MDISLSHFTNKNSGSIGSLFRIAPLRVIFVTIVPFACTPVSWWIMVFLQPPLSDTVRLPYVTLLATRLIALSHYREACYQNHRHRLSDTCTVWTQVLTVNNHLCNAASSLVGRILFNFYRSSIKPLFVGDREERSPLTCNNGID